MAITPINGISFGNRYNTVTPKYQENEKIQQSPNKTSKMVTIPVALWMALSPQISSAEETLPSPKVDSVQATPTVLLNYNKDVEVVDDRPYYLQDEYLRYSREFEVDGKDYTMYYMDMGTDIFEDERVGGVYIVPEDFKLVRNRGMELNSPMNVIGIVFHRTGNAQKDFVGAITVEDVCNDDGSNQQKIIKEIKLAPEIGDELLDLHFGHSEYHLANPKSIGYEVVEGDKLMEARIAPVKFATIDD